MNVKHSHKYNRKKFIRDFEDQYRAGVNEQNE